MEWQEIFQARLRRELKQAGKNQMWLARKIRYSRNTVNSIINGRNAPSADFIVETAKALGVSSDYLLGLKEVKDNA